MWKRIDLMAEGDEAGAGSAGAGDAAAVAIGTNALAGEGGDAGKAGDAGAGDAGKAGAAGEGKASEGKADDAGKAGEPKDKPGFWPENWRETVSKDDAKLLKAMSRYASPEEVAKALVAAQDKIRSGELRPVLGKDAKPEEIAEYRKAMGIPETPDKYELKGVKINEAEKPFIDELMKAAHSSLQTPEQLAANINTWNTIRDAAMAKRAEDDDAIATKSEDALRDEWGTEFRRNTNLVHSLLDGSGDAALKDNLLSGRLADGTPIGSSPAVLKLLLGVALKDNPAGVILPNGSGDPTKTIDGRIKEIETLMRTDRAAYNKPEISGTDGEYQKLLKAREAMKSRV